MTRPRAGTLGGLLSRYLSEQHDELVRSELTLDTQVGQHPTAQAARRLDAELQIFTPVFDDAPAAQLKEELSWFGSLLSEVSDREELAARMQGQLRALRRADDSWDAVDIHLQLVLEAEKAVPLTQLNDAVHSERYQKLLGLLGEWHASPPLNRKGGLPQTAVDKYLTRAVDEYQRSLTRGAARRVRYAAEVSRGHLGRKATKSVTRLGRLEPLLFEHDVSARTVEFLMRVGPVAGTDGKHQGFAFGRLCEQELRRGAEGRARLEQARS